MQSSLVIHSIGIIHKSPTTAKTTPFRNNLFGCNSGPLQLITLPLVPHHHFGCYTSCSSSIFPIWTVTNYQRRRRTRTEATPSPLNDSATPPNSNGSSGGFASAAELVSAAFPLWVTLACLIALFRPSSFSWLTPRLQVPGITLTMLGMGMTLTLDDLQGAFAMPKELISGFVLQYSVMPLSGAIVSKLLRLPPHYAAGLILVACCPGGTASNIVTYLARGNVALSVLMTAASTISAVVMTPFLTSKLAGQFVAVDAAGLFISTVQVVLAPVLFGAFLNQYFHSVVKVVSPIMPPIAVSVVAILCGSAIAQNASGILQSGGQVVLACFALHASGFFLGYVLSRMLGIDKSSSRTISIEVGMQNSVLGVVLATQHFSNPLTAVPCAVSSVCHSIFGSVLAGIWRNIPPNEKED